MEKFFFLVILLIGLTANLQKGVAQLIYFSDSGGQMFTVDIGSGTCDVNLLGNITFNGNGLIPTDLAFHPNGNLYLTAGGGLYTLELNTLEANYIGDHNTPNGDFINALVCDSDGVLYGADTRLFTININTGNATSLGILPCESAGDLAFNNNELYLACQLNNLLKIDIDNPSESEIIGTLNANDLFFGIVTSATECSDVQTFGTAGNGLYQITVENAGTQFICTLNGAEEVYGAAMETDFIASDCKIVLDLDGDNSSGALGIDFDAGLICGETETMVADGDFSITTTLPDLIIDSIVFEITAGLVDGADEQLILDQSGTEYDVFGSGTSRVLAINTAGAMDAGAAHALENLIYTNLANPYTSGLREVSVQVFASDDIESDIAIAFITLVTPSAFSIDLGMDTVLCGGETLLLDAAIEEASAYEWNDSSEEPALLVDATGTYSVTVTDDCGSTASDEIFVEFLPPVEELELGTDLILCPGESVTLEAGLIDGISYIWNNGAETSSIEVLETGLYAVSVTAGCGIQTDEIFIEFQDVFDLSIFPEDTLVCQGDNILLDATLPNALGYTWERGDTTPSIVVTEPGSYQVTVSFQCFEYSDEISVFYNEYDLSLDFGPDSTFCFGDSIVLNAESPFAINYLWQDGSAEPQFTILETGTYGLTVTDGCTTTSDQVFYEMESCCNVFIPNVFSPNFDGANDDFSTFSNCTLPTFSLKVFNRWGALVYETNDQSAGWDGQFKGKNAQEGVYVWLLNYFDGVEDQMRSGSVTLMR